MTDPGSASTVPPAATPIVLAGIGRDGSCIVNELVDAPEGVQKLYLTAAPTRALAGSNALLRIREGENWRGELNAALAGCRLIVAVAATAGREEAFVPDVLAVARSAGAPSIAVLVEPLLAGSSYKADEAERLIREVTKAADATIVAPAEASAPIPLSVSEALETWSQRLRAALAGLLNAAAADDTVNLDFADILAVFSGHCRATVGVAEGQSVEEAIRAAARNSLCAPPELETARMIAARILAGKDLPLDEARRAGPILEHLFPRAEIVCGVAVADGLHGVSATIMAARLDADTARARERRRALAVESPFFKVGDPTMYDGENLDIPAFVRKDMQLPGSPPRPVPEQKTLFDNPQPIPA